MRTYLPITISKRFLYRLIWLNLFFFLSYLIVNISEFWFVNIKINNIIFSQPDTCNYLLTSEWLIGSATPSSLSQNCSLNFFESKLPFITIRPFLYPTFLLLLKLFVNDQQYPFLIWLIQFLILWASINLVALTIYQLTKKQIFFFASFICLATDISSLLFPVYALTEALNIFLLSILVTIWNISSFQHRRNIYSVLILSLLAVTKPIYQIHFVLFVIFLLAQKNSRIDICKNKIKYFCAIIPILIQFMFYFWATGKFGFSDISNLTFRNYFLSQVYKQLNWQNVDTIEQARQIVADLSNEQIFKTLLENPRITIGIFRRNVIDESLLGPAMAYRNETLFHISLILNKLKFFFHIFMFSIISYLLIKRKENLLSISMLAYVFFVLQAISAGVSAFEGDRLIATAIPLWLVTYSYFLNVLTQQVSFKSIKNSL
ncbi:MAG: hypothetical protein WCL57_03730 [Chloroflexota bacterium]|jgi:hypothetical protein